MSAIFLTWKPGFNSLDWKFKDPDTGFDFLANSRADLVRQIIVYRTNNQLEPIENLDLVLNDYLCRLDSNSGKCWPVSTLSRGFMATFKGGVTLLKSMAFKAFATQEVADSRARVCDRCPENVFPDKHGFIKYVDVVALHTIGSRKSNPSDSLGNCAVCTCILKAKVWIDSKNLSATEEEMQKFPDTCWVKKELEARG